MATRRTAIKNNPRLKGVEIPNTGAPTRGTGLLVTSTLLFGGEGGATPVLRAWDKKTGAVVAEIQMPGPTTGFPVTYTKAGRQYIAVAVRVGDAVEIVALALPAATAPAGRGGDAGAAARIDPGFVPGAIQPAQFSVVGPDNFTAPGVALSGPARLDAPPGTARRVSARAPRNGQPRARVSPDSRHLAGQRQLQTFRRIFSIGRPRASSSISLSR